MNLARVLAEQLDLTRDWTLRLIADMQGDDWAFSPAAGLAHATWTLGHLAVSQNVLIHVRCLGCGVVEDSFAAHFPISGPVPAIAEHAYPPLAEIRAVFDDVHGRTLAAVRGMSEALLAEPAFGKDGAIHPHYRDKLGAVSHAGRHEAFHAGQLAMIRRLRGKSFLR